MWDVRKKENTLRVWWGNLKEMYHLGEERMLRWDDDIELNFTETEFDGLNWINLSSGTNKYEHVMKPGLP